MKAEQYQVLMSKINSSLSEMLTRVDQETYIEAQKIITEFYNSHNETEPTKNERDSLIAEFEVYKEQDIRRAVTVCTIIIWIIKVYDLGDQLEKEYIYQRRNYLYNNTNVEELESLEFIGPDL